MEKQFLPEKISGERITLKRHQLEIAEKMFQYVEEDRERLAKFLPWVLLVNSVQDEIAFLNDCNKSWDDNSAASYGIFRNHDDEYMGNISAFDLAWRSCHTEIGYWILGKFEGKGYISESVKLLENILFNMGFNRIVIRVDPHNLKSAAVPQRLNYKHEGTLREVILVGDDFRDLDIYSKLKREFTPVIQDLK